MLRPRRVNDQIGAGDLRHQAAVDRQDRLALGKERVRSGAAGPRERPLGRGQRPIDEVDLADPVRPPHVHDRLFRRQQPSVVVEGDQPGVGAVGNVLDEPRRQPEQRAVFVDGGIEAAAGEQESAREHQIAEAAVREIERTAGSRHLVGEAQQPRANPGSRRVLQRPHQSRQLVA